MNELPFGKHKGEPLEQVPTSYLRYLARGKLSSPVRAAVSAELRRRGVEPPPPPEPTWRPQCPDHPQAGLRCHWLEDSLGRRRVTAECAVCRCRLGCPPSQPPYSTLADASQSPAPVLDALTQLEALGIDLESDGRTVWVPWPHYKRVPPDLLATIRSCSHLLACLIGNTRQAAGTTPPSAPASPERERGQRDDSRPEQPGRLA